MDFHFLHMGLAAGASLGAIPIVIHLILRQKPRPEVFPAIRLVRHRHRITVRKLRIRHWLLLLLRMALLALLALALGRPSIQGSSFVPDQRAPVAAAMIFDTSMSMEYRHREQTRLDQAKEAAIDLLREFADGSTIWVVDTADPSAQYYPDIGLAQQRVESLRLRPAAGSVNQSIREAMSVLKESEIVRKELYLFSDMTFGAIDREDVGELAQSSEDKESLIPIYVLDLHIPEPRNSAIREVSLSSEVLPAFSELRVTADLDDAGVGNATSLELWLDGDPRGSHPVAFDKRSAARVEFPLAGLGPGIHHGKLVLRGGGGLEFDDTHFLTIECRQPTRALLISEDRIDSVALQLALAPEEQVAKQRARFECSWSPPEDLSRLVLQEYEIILLCNVAELPGASWQLLERFVRSGGGLGVFLGGRVIPQNYNQEIAQRLLPGKLSAIQNLEELSFFRTTDPSHGAVSRIHDWKPEAIGLLYAESFIGCTLREDRVRPIIDLTTGAPLLAERYVAGRGRSLLFTTSVVPTGESSTWNNLLQSGTQFVMLAHGIASHLAGHGAQRLNYRAGEDVVIALTQSESPGQFLLGQPDADEPIRGTVEPDGNAIVISSTEPVGHYDIASSDGQKPLKKGFSVNHDPGETNLTPFPADQLVKILGEDSFVVSNSLDELKESMGSVQIGRELFAWIMPIVFAFFLLEHLLANRFYSNKEK